MDTKGAVRVLRRALALGLALSAMWIMALLGGTPAREEREEPETGEERLEQLGPWGRFFLRQSPLLREYAAAPEDRPPEKPPFPAPPPHGDADDRQEYLPQAASDGEVLEHTAKPGKGDLQLEEKGLALKNMTGQEVELAALAREEVELGLELEAGPQILIYHTHASEAYTQTPSERYTPSDDYRTTDPERSVVRVGEEMAKVFRSQGFQVLHDTTLYDYPAYNGSYGRSRLGVEQCLKEHPTIRFALDVHRDALVSRDGAAYSFVTQEGDTRAAQVMLVVGSSDSGAPHPNWRSNLALAVRLQLALSDRYENLARPITLRSTRFNQDLGPGVLLVEVGGHGNTLGEAIAGGKLFAKTAGAALKELSRP